jgi:hypothetical protein
MGYSTLYQQLKVYIMKRRRLFTENWGRDFIPVADTNILIFTAQHECDESGT